MEKEIKRRPNKWTQYVHEFTDSSGNTRYAVGEWDEKNAQYTCPLDKHTALLTGCHTEFAKTPAGLGGYPTKKQALRRARWIFGGRDE